jgi:hypothetical protein
VFWDPFWKFSELKWTVRHKIMHLAVWMYTWVLVHFVTTAVQACSSSLLSRLFPENLSQIAGEVLRTVRTPIHRTTNLSTAQSYNLSVRGPARDLRSVLTGSRVSIHKRERRHGRRGGGWYREGEQRRGRTPGSLKSCGGPVCLSTWPTWKPWFCMTPLQWWGEFSLHYDSRERNVIWY